MWFAVHDIWTDKYGKEKADIMWKQKCKNHSNKMSGINNPMAGISVYELWIQKYGKEEADKKMEESNKKRTETWNLKRLKKKL
jgi:hypoxanthine phosphoribosyltransferase